MADQKELKEFLDLDGLAHLWERIKEKLSQSSGGDGAGAAIVDMTELPTENIKDDVLYRLLTGTIIFNGESFSGCTCYCVPSLPETGQPVSDGVNFVVYYNQQDGAAYGYVPDAMAAQMGATAGWYTLNVLAPMMDMPYGGVVVTAEGTEADTVYILLEYAMYSYKDGWSKIVKSWDDLQDRPFYVVSEGWEITYDPETQTDLPSVQMDESATLYLVSELTPANEELKSAELTVVQNGATQTIPVTAIWDSIESGGMITDGFVFLQYVFVVRDVEAFNEMAGAEVFTQTGTYFMATDSSYAAKLSEPQNVKKIDPMFLPEGETIGRAGEGECAEVFNGENNATGDYSHAEGSGTTASGIYAHAEGHETRARGEASHAEGYNTEAEGPYSSARGYGTKAWGYASHAEGIETKAFAEGSHAEGFQTETYDSGNFDARYSHAEGHQSWARGYASHAEGSSCAEGRYSHAEGSSSASGEASHSEGHNTSAEGAYAHAEGDKSSAYGRAAHSAGFETLAYGNYAHSEGKGIFYQIKISGNAGAVTYTSNYNVSDHWVGGFLQATANIEGDSDLFEIISVDANENSITLDRTIHSSFAANNSIAYVITGFASGEASHSEGYNTKAEGVGAHAEGCQAKAIGDYAHAEGYFTKAEGDYSHAEGGDTRTTGQYSHAEGYYTHAGGQFSHAEGVLALTYGEGAHAEGRDTIARGDNQHVQGKYNVEDTEGKYAHIVGNGSGSNVGERSNAHTVDWEGNGWFAGDIYVGGNSQDEGKKLLATRAARFVIGTSANGWTSKDCDYLCDGSADDVEINAAITALPSTGGEVILLDGTYNITAAIKLGKAGVSLRGNGQATKLVRAFSGSYMIYLSGGYGVVENLCIDGASGTYTSSSKAIYALSGNNIVRDCFIQNHSDYGIHFAAGKNKATGNTVTKCYSGIVLDDEQNIVSGNLCLENTNYGIDVEDDQNVVTGNIARLNAKANLYLFYASYNTINSNNFSVVSGDSVTPKAIHLYSTNSNNNFIVYNQVGDGEVTIGGGTGNVINPS